MFVLASTLTGTPVEMLLTTNIDSITSQQFNAFRKADEGQTENQGVDERRVTRKFIIATESRLKLPLQCLFFPQIF